MIWINQPKDIKEYHGFVYEIKNKLNGKYYIGRKTFILNKARQPLKSNKNRRLYTEESDWKNYWGSNKDLQEDVKKYGEENFDRIILVHCKNKWEEAYYEAKIQFERDVLNDNKSYNGIINCRIKRLRNP